MGKPALGSRITDQDQGGAEVDQSQLSSDSGPDKTRVQEQGGAEGDQASSCPKKGRLKIPAAFGTAGTALGKEPEEPVKVPARFLPNGTSDQSSSSCSSDGESSQLNSHSKVSQLG